MHRVPVLSREVERPSSDDTATNRPATQSGRHCRMLGELMCEATEQLLWNPAEQWIRQQHHQAQLRCIVGRGKATYHRRDPGEKTHLIVYGQRMIAAKQQATTAEGWLSLREIRRRGYYGGQCSVITLIAHTCCHEFAHLLQSVAGQRYRGSVHNHHFYRILDGLHESGAADEVRRRLADEAEKSGLMHLETEFAPIPSPADSWQIGDRVSFGEGPRRKSGTILRLNPRTCTVEGNGLWHRQRYRVPYALLCPSN